MYWSETFENFLVNIYLFLIGVPQEIDLSDLVTDIYYTIY